MNALKVKSTKKSTQEKSLTLALYDAWLKYNANLLINLERKEVERYGWHLIDKLIQSECRIAQ